MNFLWPDKEIRLLRHLLYEFMVVADSVAGTECPNLDDWENFKKLKGLAKEALAEHIMDVKELNSHEISTKCICNPTVTTGEYTMIVTHKKRRATHAPSV